MQNIINYQNFRSFAYSNDKLCSNEIKGVVITFNGLGFSAMYSDDDSFSKELAEKGIINIVPYFNPWSWMNRQTVELTDELVDVIFKHYNLDGCTSIVSCGGSMGGLSCLVYAKYAVRTPVSCVANCPVCDLPYHYTERPDLPRTLYSAFKGYDGTFEDALKSASPIHLADSMPKIKYYIFHCDRDTCVNKEKHSDRFVSIMKKAGHCVDYYEVKGREHCDLSSEMRELYNQKIYGSILERGV